VYASAAAVRTDARSHESTETSQIMNPFASLTTLEIGLIIVSVELTAALVYSFYSQFRRKAALEGASRAAAGDLLEKVSDKAQSRRDALTLILTEAYNLEGEELEKFADEFIAREEEFYKAIAEVFANRDYERLQTITEDLNKVVAPCIGMVPANQVDKSEADALKSMVDALEDTNQKLNQNLAETTTNLEQITAEYNAAFARAAGEAAAAAAGDDASNEVVEGADDGVPDDSPMDDLVDEAVTDTVAEDAESAPEVSPDTPDETESSKETAANETQAAAPEMNVDESGIFDLSADDIDNLIENMGEDTATA